MLFVLRRSDGVLIDYHLDIEAISADEKRCVLRRQ